MGSSLKHIRIVPLAAESLGTRSMCTYAETTDARLLLDAGVSLCPSRYGLPPHPREFRAIIEARRRMAEMAEKAEVVTLSHYHFDHHTPSFEDWLSNWTQSDDTARQIYENKIVLIKNPRMNVNYSQRHRGWMFQKTSREFARGLRIADGKAFSFGDTKLTFSEPVFHGPEGSALGWVLMVTVECQEEKFMFAPDVQGPASSRTLSMIAAEKPQLLMLGGPPLYLSGFRVDENEIQKAMGNLQRVVTCVQTTILEHHILRDEEWTKKTAQAIRKAREAHHAVVTAAEYLSSQNAFLEARRKKLYSEEPPSKDFEKWMKTSEDSKRLSRPPI